MQNNDENTEAAKPTRSSKLDLNSIATIGAVILSLVAISISVIEVTTMRTQQRAAVWPYLQMQSSYSANIYTISLENKGVGPALIKYFSLFVDNRAINDVDQMVIDVVGAENAFSYDVYRVSAPNNSVISPQEQLRLFSVPLRTRQTKQSETMTDYIPGILFAENSRERLDIHICYCSIHEDCWLTTLQTTTVETVSSCDAISNK